MNQERENHLKARERLFEMLRHESSAGTPDDMRAVSVGTHKPPHSKAFRAHDAALSVVGRSTAGVRNLDEYRSATTGHGPGETGLSQADIAEWKRRDEFDFDRIRDQDLIALCIDLNLQHLV